MATLKRRIHEYMPNRRDFLLLRTPTRAFDLDCEPLYMRYLDSLDDQTSDDLRDAITRDLQGTTGVRVVRTAWLAREDFRAWLAPVLEQVRKSGVKVEMEGGSDGVMG